MKLKEYIDSRGGPKEACESQRLYVPKRMQDLFGLGCSVDVTSPRLTEYFKDERVILTREMVDYLEISPETAQLVVGLSLVHIVSRTEGDPKPSDPPMLKEVFALREMKEVAYNDYVASCPRGYTGNQELFTLWQSKQSDYYDKEDEWTAVLDVVNNAILEKLEAPVFDESSDDDDDAYGLLYRDNDTLPPSVGDADYVVSECSGEYSDYDSSPVAVCKTERAARTYVKRIHKTLWSTKPCLVTDDYMKKVHAFNPRLLSNQAAPRYTIDRVPRVG